MLDQTYSVPQNASDVLGDVTALAEQLGSAEALGPSAAAAASLGSTQVTSVPALESFLTDYTAGILLAHELPAVLEAYEHAARYEVRELIELDQRLARMPALQRFENASCHVGRTQLRRLRPLRDERVVRRYFNAVEAGDAKAWHTLVFGLVLAVYSLPLRQGLAHFAARTIGGFIEAASQRMTIVNSERARLLAVQSTPISGAIERLVADGRAPMICSS